MAQYIMILTIEDTYYREFSEQGTTKDELLEELKRDIHDQLDDYDCRRLMTRMLSSQRQEDTVTFVPKKNCEEPQFLRIPLVMS